MNQPKTAAASKVRKITPQEKAWLIEHTSFPCLSGTGAESQIADWYLFKADDSYYIKVIIPQYGYSPAQCGLPYVEQTESEGLTIGIRPDSPEDIYYQPIPPALMDRVRAQLKTVPAEYPQKDVLRINEIAALLQISVRHVHNLMKLSGFPAFKIGRSVRALREDVIAWARSHSCTDENPRSRARITDTQHGLPPSLRLRQRPKKRRPSQVGKGGRSGFMPAPVYFKSKKSP